MRSCAAGAGALRPRPEIKLGFDSGPSMYCARAAQGGVGGSAPRVGDSFACPADHQFGGFSEVSGIFHPVTQVLKAISQKNAPRHASEKFTRARSPSYVGSYKW